MFLAVNCCIPFAISLEEVMIYTPTKSNHRMAHLLYGYMEVVITVETLGSSLS